MQTRFANKITVDGQTKSGSNGVIWGFVTIKRVNFAVHFCVWPRWYFFSPGTGLTANFTVLGLFPDSVVSRDFFHFYLLSHNSPSFSLLNNNQEGGLGHGRVDGWIRC
jgi:hypothetical protein